MDANCPLPFRALAAILLSRGITEEKEEEKEYPTDAPFVPADAIVRACPLKRLALG